MYGIDDTKPFYLKKMFFYYVSVNYLVYVSNDVILQ